MPEDSRSVPFTHLRDLTTACNSRDLMSSSGGLRYLHTRGIHSKTHACSNNKLNLQVGHGDAGH